MQKILLTLITLLSLSVSAKPITATSWLVADGAGKILQSENIDEVRPIASISKLMTVYTVLKAEQDMDEKLTVRNKKTPTTKLVKGMRLTRKDLIELALVSSDNVASGLEPMCIHAISAFREAQSA